MAFRPEPAGKVIPHPTIQTAPSAPLTLVPPAVTAPTAQTRPAPQVRPSSRSQSSFAAPAAPFWLQALLVIQRGSSILTFCLATAVLIVYGSTVYIQQAWSEEFRQLEQLQREKRELTTADELMKNQLAQQAAAPENGLVAPSPANTIFLPRATHQPVQAPITPLLEVRPDAPLGY
ncbi:MAG: hypothetical protein EA366_09705 [Spirulina sp. DLM2.Bin59]|nr:MAG: hypothetical protein EA366_09705 [Spirulina sp. DLM2.Bin59]